MPNWAKAADLLTAINVGMDAYNNNDKEDLQKRLSVLSTITGIQGQLGEQQLNRMKLEQASKGNALEDMYKMEQIKKLQREAKDAEDYQQAINDLADRIANATGSTRKEVLPFLKTKELGGTYADTLTKYQTYSEELKQGAVPAKVGADVAKAREQQMTSEANIQAGVPAAEASGRAATGQATAQTILPQKQAELSTAQTRAKYAEPLAQSQLELERAQAALNNQLANVNPAAQKVASSYVDNIKTMVSLQTALKNLTEAKSPNARQQMMNTIISTFGGEVPGLSGAGDNPVLMERIITNYLNSIQQINTGLKSVLPEEYQQPQETKTIYLAGDVPTDADKAQAKILMNQGYSVKYMTKKEQNRINRTQQQNQPTPKQGNQAKKKSNIADEVLKGLIENE